MSPLTGVAALPWSQPRLAAFLAVILLMAATVPVLAQAGPPADGGPSPCGGSGAPIGSIRIERTEVFEAGSSGMADWIGRSANAIHVQTWERTIRAYLLFREGDACTDEAIAQTERNLRATGLFQKVDVLSSPREDGTLEVVVRARDAWTLRIDGDYRRTGGVTTWAIRLGDLNAAGSGISLGVKRQRQIDADVTSAWFDQPRLFGSPERLAIRADRRSDGRANGVSLTRPFDSLESRWGHEIGYAETRDHLRLYEDQDITDTYARRAIDAVAGVAVRVASPSPASVWRLGTGFRFTAREHEVLPAASVSAAEPPPSHRWAGPYLNLHLVEHRFIERTGLYVPGRDVDINLGAEFTVSSFVSGRLTSLDTSPRVALGTSVAHGWLLPGDGVLVATAFASGQWGGPEPGRAEAGGVVRTFWQPTPMRARTLLVEARSFVNPDSGSRLYLGGASGLRGYRQFTFAGTRTLLAVAEERKYFDWVLLRMLQFGVAGFAEAGVIGGVPGEHGTSRAAANIGAGLRIAQLWSAGTVVRVDVAYPLVSAPDGTRRPLLVVEIGRTF